MGKLKKATSVGIIIALLGILSYEVPAMRNFIKVVALWANSVFQLPYLGDYISNGFIYEERFLAGAIIVLLFAKVILGVILWCKGEKTKKCEPEDAFELSLLRYLNQSKSSRCYLISGQWGSGKTYLINSFIDNYYKNSLRRIYRVSCIGLVSREDVIGEISKVIERTDDEFRKTLLKGISYIPIVGEFLMSVLGKKYGYGSAKKNSIFVFDDFERLASHIDGAIYSTGGYNNYTKNDDSEAGKISSSLKEVNEKQLVKQDLDKYLVITGIINEMIEIYKYKVIIVCDTNRLGERFVSEVLRSKLNCIEYKVRITEDSAQSLSKQIVDRFVMEDKDKHMLVAKFIRRLDMRFIGMAISLNNLRFLGNLIEAFVIAVDLFEVSALQTEGFMESILSSIMMVNNVASNGQSLESLKKRPVGINIGLIGGSKLCNCKKCRWVGYEIAAYWHMNLPMPKQPVSSYNAWKTYKYVDLEQDLLEGKFGAMGDYDFNIFHLCYMQNYSPEKLESPVNWTKYLSLYLEKIDLRNPALINQTLVEYARETWNFSSVYQEILFEEIAKKSGNTRSKESEDCELPRQYNEYLDRLKESKL